MTVECLWMSRVRQEATCCQATWSFNACVFRGATQYIPSDWQLALSQKKQKKANRTQWSSCILYTIARTSVLVRVVVYSPNCSWILMFMLSNIQIVRQSSRTTYSGLLYVLTSFASLAASKFFSISPLQRKKKLTWQLI